MMRGRFITLDGSEGVGKSTQIALLRDWLAAHHIPAHFTREPGGTSLGEALRTLLLDPQTQADAHTELLLILAARNEHLVREIRPRLARGEWVICDRYNDSTYAYQGAARGIPATAIAAFEALLPAHLEPDLRLILGLSPTESTRRMAARGSANDRFEQESEPFFDAVREAYRTRAQLDNACFIDASGSPQAVFARIVQALAKLE